MEHQPTGNELWILSWIIANSPWIWAGVFSAIVRFVFLFGLHDQSTKKSLSDAFLCGAVVAVCSPVAALFGIGQDYAMVTGIGVGMVGAEVVRADIIERIKAFARKP